MKAIATWLSVTALTSLLWLISLPVLITPSEAQPAPSTRRAPGPVLGAGVSILVIAGGAYWVATRLRRKSG
jgi:hypothetical protein